MDADVEVAVDIGDTFVSVVVAGEVDSATVAAVTDALERALAVGVGRIAVDLSGVEYLGSPGIHALFDAHEQAVATGGGLRIVAASAIVTRLLDVVGLQWLLATQHSDDRERADP